MYQSPLRPLVPSFECDKAKTLLVTMRCHDGRRWQGGRLRWLPMLRTEKRVLEGLNSDVTYRHDDYIYMHMHMGLSEKRAPQK